MSESERERERERESAMSTSKRCIKEDGGSTYNWQCSRRSHPVQRMGGVCAMCLTERLSNIARCAEAGRPPRLTEQASCGFLRLAAFHESMDSEGIAPMLTQCKISVQQCDYYMGVQETSARHSSAGSEQSIASLIEREIDEGRQRYSDVTAGFSILPAGLKELAVESSNERRAAACAKQQLARSRSYSTNSHVNSIHSTPASCKSNSALLSGTAGDSCKPCSCGSRTDCTTSSNGRRCCTAAAVERSSYHALLTKSKSTGSNYNANKQLRSPIHVWNIPNFWHKKCNHMQETRYDSSSDDHSSVTAQADDSVPFMKLPRSCSKNAGAANCINRDMMCLGKWLNRSTHSSFFHPPRRRTTSRKGCSTSTSIMQSRRNSSACAQESLAITQEVAASSSSATAATASYCSADLQVVIAKGVSLCGRWRLPSFNMSQKSARRRASTIDSTPDVGLGVISATNQISAYDDQYSKLRDQKGGAERGAADLVTAHSQNVGEGADDEEGKTAECNEDGAAGVICTNNHEIPHRDTAESSSPSTYTSRNRPGSGHLLNMSSQFSIRSRVEYTPTLYSGHGMKMHPNIMHQCQSIAALVSMDANLIHLI